MSTYAVDGDKLTAIADAIRLKRDLTTDLTLDDMALQIGLIESGGGTSESSQLVVLQKEMTIKAIIEENHIPVNINSGLIMVTAHGTKAATTGTRTVSWVILFFKDNEKIGLVYNYKNGLYDPDSMVFNTIGTNNASYFTVSSGEVTSINNTNYLAAGTEIRVTQAEFDFLG